MMNCWLARASTQVNASEPHVNSTTGGACVEASMSISPVMRRVSARTSLPAAFTSVVRLVGVDQQLHLQRLHVAGHELQQRAPKPGDRDLREVVVAADRVLLRVEQHRDAFAGDGVGDRGLLERHRSDPVRSR